MMEDLLAPGTGSPQTQHLRSFLVITLLQSGQRELQLGMAYLKRNSSACPWSICTVLYCAFRSKVCSGCAVIQANGHGSSAYKGTQKRNRDDHNREHGHGAHENFQVERNLGCPEDAAAGVAIRRLRIRHRAAFRTLLWHINWLSFRLPLN